VRAPISNDRPSTSRRPCLLVIAAGASRRFGGRPKALLEVDGEPAVRRVLRAARSAGLEDAVIVVGPHGVPIRAALAGDPARIVPNDDWELGRTGSIQAGLREIEADRDVLLWPIDYPFVQANTVRELEGAAHRDPVAAWIMPTFEGRGGHPVWLTPAATRLVPGLTPDASLRLLIPRLGVQVLRVPTTDPWVRIGTDTPDEYEAATGRRRRER